MLSINTASEAISLTDELLKSNLTLTTLAGSPLAQLVDSCLNSEFIANGTLDKGAFSPSIVNSLSTVKGNDGKSEHDLVKAEISDAVVKVIQANKDLARNTVVPLIKTIKARFDDIAASTGTEFIANLAIVPITDGEVYQHPVLDQLVEPYAETSLGVFYAPAALGPKLETAEDVQKLLVTGHSDIDTLVAEIVSKDPSGVVNLYTNYFYQPSSDYTYDKVFNAYLGNKDAALVVFLIARNFMLNTPSGINYELSEYEALVSSIAQQGANCIRNYAKIKVDERAQKRLVLNTPFVNSATVESASTVAIHVDSVTYNDFLSNGGTPELLMGAVIEGKSFNYDYLIANAETLNATYEYYITMRGEVLSQRKETVLVNAYDRTIREYIEELGDKADGPTKDQMRAKYSVIFSGLNVHSFSDTYVLIRNTVCDVFFAHTDAKTILCSMDHLSVKFPNKPMSEVASLALLDYATNWVMQFVLVKKLG